MSILELLFPATLLLASRSENVSSMCCERLCFSSLRFLWKCSMDKLFVLISADLTKNGCEKFNFGTTGRNQTV